MERLADGALYKIRRITLADKQVAVALKKISRSAPEVPPIEDEMESASLSHNTALSAEQAAFVVK